MARQKEKKDKDPGRKIVAQNRKARYNYHLVETYEAGMVLTGTEVKSLRQGRASLVDGYAAVRGDELWLLGVHIPEYTEGTWTNHEPRRARKLLLHRHELDEIVGKANDSGVTIVPLALYFKDGKAKVEVAVARGKRAYDKRKSMAERDAKREMDRARRVRARGA
ncbi:MAG: SsrA-binding protein SmpB [Streptosporangiales bacterium]|nr:SsrA-binding protein SmpB [Streptosporangiales bacterium]